MKSPFRLVLIVFAVLMAATPGCHGSASAGDTSGSAPAAPPSKAGAMGASSNSTLGLNPNYQGPANGGVGSKVGSQ